MVYAINVKVSDKRRCIMPGYDGTGPRGMGAMTGGGRGSCVASVGRDVVRPRLGRQGGRGGGRGWRNMYYDTGMTSWQRRSITPEQEKEILKDEENYFKQELSDIQNRISVLEKKK